MIEKMTRYNFILLGGEEEQFLAGLQELGVVDITRSFKPVDDASNQLLLKAESLKDAVAFLGSQDFPRIRIGVGAKPHPDYDLADWVLSSFTPEEEKLLAPALDHAAAAALELIQHGPQMAASKFNGK